MTDPYTRAVDTIDNLTSNLLPPPLASAYALLALTKGTDTTPADVHDAWALHTRTTHPDHPALVPYTDLDTATQELDMRWVRIIHQATHHLNTTGPAPAAAPNTP